MSLWARVKQNKKLGGCWVSCCLCNCLFLIVVNPFPSTGSHSADSSVTKLGHGRTCRHSVLLIVPKPTMTTPMARRDATWERGEQSFAEACVHEAVNNRVDAGGGVAQQMDKSDGGPWERLCGRAFIKSPPGVDTVQWHPTDKEQDNNHHQHANDSFFGL